MRLRSRKAGALRGSVRLPGDKSISHRAALLAAMAEGRSRIEGMLRAGVTRVMLDSLSELGVNLRWDQENLIIEGRGKSGFQSKEMETAAGGSRRLNCGNSAATIRFLTGVLAGKPEWETDKKGGEFIMDGSVQLQKRPMKRIIEPLCEMGARIRSIDKPGYAPFIVEKTKLSGIDYQMSVASAQVKTTLLLAGLAAAGSTFIVEPSPSRDHTERLLHWLGVRMETGPCNARVFPIEKPLPPLALRVPGDFSSAAFLIVAAAVIPGSDVILQGVGVNPRRTGLLSVLRRMGARIEELSSSESAGEPIGDLRVRAGPLAATSIDGGEVVDMIDEFPVLAVAAACAEGVTEVRNAGELRHKESDRISVLGAELRKAGIHMEETSDGFSIRGPVLPRGALVDSHGDHRLAMSLAVAGMVSQDGMEIDGAECISESFPDFTSLFNGLGAQLG